MDEAEKAYINLYPDKKEGIFKYRFSLAYSGRFSDFNANVKKLGNRIHFSLSKRWKGVDPDIRLGLLQDLMAKILKDKRDTHHTRLYHIFIRQMHLAAPRNDSEKVLLESFARVNERFFMGLMDMPNLKFGKDSRGILGSYNYHNDTITISSLLREADTELLDYVVYHELLHKKLQFRVKEGRSYHHTGEFKRLERQFPHSRELEIRLRRLSSAYVRKKPHQAQAAGNARKRLWDRLFGH